MSLIISKFFIIFSFRVSFSQGHSRKYTGCRKRCCNEHNGIISALTRSTATLIVAFILPTLSFSISRRRSLFRQLLDLTGITIRKFEKTLKLLLHHRSILCFCFWTTLPRKTVLNKTFRFVNPSSSGSLRPESFLDKTKSS